MLDGGMQRIAILFPMIDQHYVVAAVSLFEPVETPFPATLPIPSRTNENHWMALVHKLLHVGLAVQLRDPRQRDDARFAVLPDALQHSLLQAAAPIFKGSVDALSTKEVIHSQECPIASNRGAG